MGWIWAALDMAARELLLFAGVWMTVGFLDELAIEALWVVLKVKGRGRVMPFAPSPIRALRGPIAVFIPCWHEAAIIGSTLQRLTTVWPHPELRIWVGVYANDPATQTAVACAAAADSRIGSVVVPRPGPTTKADCLNEVYRAMKRDEAATGQLVRCVLLHDAEDFVHPWGLDLIDDRLERADYVQLPVVPEMQPAAKWIAGQNAFRPQIQRLAA